MVQIQPLKDYYNILGVLPNVNDADLKKAYRRMAMQYHPDKNPENIFAATHFKEIHEAYSILSNPKSREKYNEERWLSGMSKNVHEEPMLSAAAINNKCKQLMRHLNTIDTHTMDHAALQAYILLLLNDERMAILKFEQNNSENEAIVNTILVCVHKLRFALIAPIAKRLKLIALGNNKLETAIVDFVKKRNNQLLLERAMPFIIIVISILLAWAMYHYGLKH